MISHAIASALALFAGPISARDRLLGSSFGASVQSIFHPSTNATYDYIVVGGGTGGLPMATRLAEAGYSVAVLEAGSFYEIGNSNLSQVPMYAPAFSGLAQGSVIAPLVDWNFTTTPQTGEDDRIQLYPQGKTLGGSSARNYQAFHFGTNGSYQAWADAVGDQSYAMEGFYKYLHKPLNFTPPVSSRDPNSTATYAKDLLQDTQGPLQIGFGAFTYGFSSWAQNAMAQAGLPRRSDGFTTGAINGSSYVLLTIDNTKFERDSSETSYLQKIGLENENLVVYTQTLATRILFDSNKTACGVVADMGGLSLDLYARKEVIVSAGTFKSPQLLMVSGIGPKSTLKAHGIQVISDLAGVGQNMWDHTLGGITRRVKTFGTGSIGGSVDIQNQALAEYLSDPPRGPYTSFASDVFAFEKLPQSYQQKLSDSTRAALAQFPADWPNVEYFINNGFNGPQPGFIGSPDGLDWGSIIVGLVSPLSRGNVTIQSADMHVKPIVNPGWLENPMDQEVAVQGFRRLQEFFNQSSIQGVLEGNGSWPAADDVRTDAQILAHIKSTFASVLHASCTCKMGRANDTMAVLDSRARVYGVNNLRVVDASSFPLLPPGHPQATVYGLAEKIATDIITGLS